MIRHVGMRKRLFIGGVGRLTVMTLSVLLTMVFAQALWMCAQAETVVLRTGARVTGTIILQNEEVVIVRNEEGARFQYPRAEVETIVEEGETGLEDERVSGLEEEVSIQTPKKASVLLELAGGVAGGKGSDAGLSVSAAYSVDLLVGSHHIGNRHIFVGGGLGFHGEASGYNFLPIQAALRMPLTENRHAPVFGVSLGYGVALSKEYLGGLYTGLDFGYRCQLNHKTAIGVVAFGQFQQAKIHVVETVEGVEFVNHVGRNLFAAGLKFTLYI